MKVKKELEDRLYRGLKSAYECNRNISGKRISISSGKGKLVLQKSKGICPVSGEKYVENPLGFEIHHIDGDRTNDKLTNLILLSKTSHGSITGSVKVRITDYIRKHPREVVKSRKQVRRVPGSPNIYRETQQVFKAQDELKSN